jgi:chorismate mutase-like protein
VSSAAIVSVEWFTSTFWQPDPVFEPFTKIDTVDRRLVALLNERATLVRDIGRLKQQSGVAVNDPTRAADVLRRVTGANRGPLPNEHLQRIYEAIVREMTRSRSRRCPGRDR